MPRWVTQDTSPVSAIRMERCPPSAWNGVRHHSGMLSAIRAERCPGWRGIRNFRCALDRVVTGDLVFVDPPYLYGDDQVDQQSYNVDRFGVGDVRFLSVEMRRLVNLGAHVIFCWGERAEALVPDGGGWIEIGRDFVWLSESLTPRMNAADGRHYRPAAQQAVEGAAE